MQLLRVEGCRGQAEGDAEAGRLEAVEGGDGGDDGGAEDGHRRHQGVLPPPGGVAGGGEHQARGAGGLGPRGQRGHVLHRVPQHPALEALPLITAEYSLSN